MEAWSDIALDGRRLYALELNADTGLKALTAYDIQLSPEAEEWFTEAAPPDR